MIIDDSFKHHNKTIVVEENKHGTVRVNGKTEREMLKKYREKYGEEAYKNLKSEIAKTKQTIEK
jgi:hypothetical protein